jgi:hypothetical protein
LIQGCSVCHKNDLEANIDVTLDNGEKVWLHRGCMNHCVRVYFKNLECCPSIERARVYHLDLYLTKEQIIQILEVLEPTSKTTKEDKS